MLYEATQIMGLMVAQESPLACVQPLPPPPLPLVVPGAGGAPGERPPVLLALIIYMRPCFLLACLQRGRQWSPHHL